MAEATMAEAPPPPLQIAAPPYWPLFCFKTCTSVTKILAPEAPSGWPNATAPPLTLTLSAESCNNLLLANATTENASFNSTKSKSLTEMPARLAAMGRANDGVVVNHSGVCSASAKPSIFAKGVRPNSFNFSPLTKITAAAPSLIVDALAAVTVPSFLKTGFNPGILSKKTFLYSSSWLITTSPFRVETVTGTISSLNFPASQAAAARL